jgi:hypothetical protein
MTDKQTETAKRKPKMGELADPNSNRSKNKALWAKKKPKKKTIRRAYCHAALKSRNRASLFSTVSGI